MVIMHIVSGGHLVHYAVLVVGLAGLIALLGPQLGRDAGRSQEPRDLHERQVAALRVAMASGRPGATLTRPVAARSEPVTVDPTPSLAVRLVLPLAVVGSGAAGLAHAVAAPEHFEEGLGFGLFFVVTALLQLTWCVATHRRRTPALLLAGALGNAAVLAVWATSRTVGLPLGLTTETEAVGAWDLACLVWELALIGGCVAMLLRGRTPRGRLPGWPDWHPVAVLWLMTSVLVLGGLTLIGHTS